MSTEPAENGVESPVEPLNLYLELEYVVVRNTGPFGKQEFIPAHSIARLLTRENVESVLNGAGRHPSGAATAVAASDIPNLADFVLKRAGNLFLVLVSTHNVGALAELHACGFDDTSLPIGKSLPTKKAIANGYRGRPSVAAIQWEVGSLNKTTHKLDRTNRWPIFGTWESNDVKSFERDQWLFLGATFTEGKFFYSFPKECPLPFISLDDEDGGADAPGSGQFSRVYKLGLYTAESQQEGSTEDGELEPEKIAVKVFRDHLKDYFYREVDTLKKIAAMDHPHLINPIAAFERGEDRCFIFPWADGGNLRDFWKNTDAKRTKGTTSVSDASIVSWALDQMCGLADCLTTLYAQNCRHGDLKPENILHFTNQAEETTDGNSESESRGRLVISDFGLAKFHIFETMRRGERSSIQDRTLRYEPPEMETDMDKPRSRDYDIWSIGCIYFEFALWLLYGWDYLEDFNRSTRNDKFWEQELIQGPKKPKTNGAAATRYMVHHRVQEEMSKILADVKAEAAVKDIVTLVRDRLLVVKVVEDAHPAMQSRASAMELLGSMNDIRQRASAEKKYLLGPKIPQRKRMGDTLTIHNGNPLTNPAVKNGASHAAVGGGDESGVRILVRAATGDFAQHNELSQPVLHPETESSPDDPFALELFKHVKWSSVKPQSTTSKLCNTCASLDFSSSSLEREFTIQELQKSLNECELCKMCYQGLAEVGRIDRAGKLVLVGSTLRAGSQGPPIISIYAEPISAPPPPEYAQVGFPRMPEPASPQQFELLRQWLRACDRNHECWPWETTEKPGLPSMPTRVIDVGHGSTTAAPTLRLVEPAATGLRARYAALSHCWGAIPDSAKFRALRGNLEQIKQGIEYARLPRTFRDAVRAVRALGIRYLWIDSLCIIQDDTQDWEAESARMEDVFNSAYVTLAASSSRSSVEGFLDTSRKPRGVVTVTAKSSTVTTFSTAPRTQSPAVGVKVDGTGATIYLCRTIDNFHRDVEKSVLNSRGWVFQERALSRRMIHFTNNQVYWECGHGVRCETLAKLQNSIAAFLGDSDFPTSALKYFKGGRIMLSQRLYKMYSELSFTEPTDRSVAMLGLEQRLASTFQTRAEFGILEEYLQRSLLWQRASDSHGVRQQRATLARITTYAGDRRVPSWSWMAYTGAIEYLEVPFKHTDWLHADLKNPFEGGSLRHGHKSVGVVAELKAVACDMSISPVDLQIRVRFDDENVVVIKEMLRCVVIGKENEESAVDKESRVHYVLVIRPCVGEVDKGYYERVGVGRLLTRHLSMNTKGWVTIR
ncbi:hypothetical protein BX600DRAFT_518114 [Xylariales sp. PMI_506]|nr:hypothetical protein BX600DRAFT_518114 [Xylariales sp. PMI_506]